MFLTKFCSSFILELEKLSEIVTASGSPSGMAHTMTEMEIIKLLRKFIQNLLSSVFPNASFMHPGSS
jgi:hypothetical protein